MNKQIMILSLALLAGCTAGVAAPKEVPANDLPETEYLLKGLFMDVKTGVPHDVTMGSAHGPGALKNCETQALQAIANSGMRYWCVKN